MNDQDLILIGRVIDGLGDVQEILRVLVNRGTLPPSWMEIESVFDSIRVELMGIEGGFRANRTPLGSGLG